MENKEKKGPSLFWEIDADDTSFSSLNNSGSMVKKDNPTRSRKRRGRKKTNIDHLSLVLRRLQYLQRDKHYTRKELLKIFGIDLVVGRKVFRYLLSRDFLFRIGDGIKCRPYYYRVTNNTEPQKLGLQPGFHLVSPHTNFLGGV
jgi:hypothetical protein